MHCTPSQESTVEAPEIGALFTQPSYPLQIAGGSYTWRVTGYARMEVPAMPGPGWYNELLGDVLGPETLLKPRMVCCAREDAEFVLGSGIAGTVARIDGIVVTGMVAWSDRLLEEARDAAARRIGQRVGC